jgi:uncharacterized protein YidB (DUF937 family)
MGMMNRMLGSASDARNVLSKRPSIMQAALGLIGRGQSGGLSGLVQMFQSRGMGDIADSWVSRGRNKPISPQQVREGLGEERIEQIAAETGKNKEETSAQLSRVLPKMVDKLTPEGRIPEGDLSDKIGALFKR